MNAHHNFAAPSAANFDPFEGLSLNEIYNILLSGSAGDATPRWPDENLQKGYTGTCGVDLLRRTFEFTRMLEADGAFVPGWRGMDYGCGWGRFASVLLTKGVPSQLDLSDAWPKTLRILAELGYQNRVLAVPELLDPDDIPQGEYDLILSFSVFTHLSPDAFEQNIPILLAGLKPGGKLYFTVRHEEFIDHKYAESAAICREVLARDGILFLDSGGNLGTQKVFGDTVIAPEYLASIQQGQTLRYLGQPHSLQHVYVIERTV